MERWVDEEFVDEKWLGPDEGEKFSFGVCCGYAMEDGERRRGRRVGMGVVAAPY